MLGGTPGGIPTDFQLTNYHQNIDILSCHFWYWQSWVNCTCFGQVVELLLLRGANKEHRNVSDYTPLSLAASGGYVNIIKILLNAGAEINSRWVKDNLNVEFWPHGLS